MICKFCGATIWDDLLHEAHCDGRQGKREALELEPVPPPVRDIADTPEPVPMFARASDPDTSREAMARYDPARILSAVDVVTDLYRARGPMADYELAPAFADAWRGPCCDHLYRQARSAARDRGQIRDSGARRINPATNRRQVVWEACDAGPVAILRCQTCGQVVARAS